MDFFPFSAMFMTRHPILRRRSDPLHAGGPEQGGGGGGQFFRQKIWPTAKTERAGSGAGEARALPAGRVLDDAGPVRQPRRAVSSAESQTD